jgi:ABC-type multidrug transport system ATPase subunit
MTSPSTRTAPSVSRLDLDRVEVRRGQFHLGPVSVQAEGGRIHALVGPNGAGKTTLIQSVLGLLPLSAGSVRLGGEPTAGRAPAVLARLGYVSDDPTEIIEELTARELWAVHARARRATDAPDRLMTRAAALAERLGFDPPPRQLIRDFSHGMRKKTQLVAGLMHEPELVVMDEPRNGLDPLGIQQLERLIADLRDAGRVVLVATHDLHWAERTADLVCVLDHGRVLRVGAVDDILEAEDDDNLVDAFFAVVAQARGEGPALDRGRGAPR